MTGYPKPLAPIGTRVLPLREGPRPVGRPRKVIVGPYTSEADKAPKFKILRAIANRMAWYEKSTIGNEHSEHLNELLRGRTGL